VGEESSKQEAGSSKLKAGSLKLKAERRREKMNIEWKDTEKGTFHLLHCSFS